ncbi:MAG: NUDIX domain-containing protein [Oscillospiraceae bacterium]
MKHEKSCGALVYRIEDGKLQILLLKHRHGGHWSFPKGHVEAEETERQTALREIFEETGLHVTLRDGFRRAVEYSPKAGVTKQVVYFLGLASQTEYNRQAEEISEIKWADDEAAFQSVTFRNDRNLIAQARDYLKKTDEL